MLKKFNRISLSLIVISVAACGDGTTPFTDVETGRFDITVSKDGPTDDSTQAYSIETGVSEDETSPSEPMTPEDAVENFFAASDKGEDATDGMGGKDPASSSPAKSEDGPRGISTDKKQTFDLCSHLFRGQAKKLVVISADEKNTALELDATTALAIKVSGNQKALSLNLSGIERMAGICIIATGNQPKISIVTDVSVGKLAYIGRGNLSDGRIIFQNDRTLDTSYIELKGNGQNLTLEGVESSHCDAAVVKGNSANALECRPSVK